MNTNMTGSRWFPKIVGSLYFGICVCCETCFFHSYDTLRLRKCDFTMNGPRDLISHKYSAHSVLYGNNSVLTMQLPRLYLISTHLTISHAAK